MIFFSWSDIIMQDSKYYALRCSFLNVNVLFAYLMVSSAIIVMMQQIKSHVYKKSQGRSKPLRV